MSSAEPAGAAEPAAPAPIRDASTVVLLRDSPDGMQTWLLSRATQMVFAAGASVFPGGRVDEADAELPFADDSPARLAARIGSDERVARELLGAAVREVFEETGVLLTTPRADLSADRTDVEEGRVGFGDLLRRHGLAVDASGLRAWSRWVTPPNESRRYDTRFFVAAMPDGAQAAHVTTEAAHAAWVGVSDALEAARLGERRMLPPTIITLASLATYSSVAEVLEAAGSRSLEAIRPTMRMTEGGDVLIELPSGETLTIPRSTFG